MWTGSGTNNCHCSSVSIAAACHVTAACHADVQGSNPGVIKFLNCSVAFLRISYPSEYLEGPVWTTVGIILMLIRKDMISKHIKCERRINCRQLTNKKARIRIYKYNTRYKCIDFLVKKS